MPKGEPFNRLPVVLLIDDDMVSREVAATLMTMSEYIVYTAENGNAAVEMLGREGFAPDAILMDAQMPGLSGTALIAALRACTKTPIYAISGSNPPPEVVAAADGFLLKPFDLSAFRKLLAGEARNVAASALDANAPVIQAETLAQFRRLMPEAAVRQVLDAGFGSGAAHWSAGESYRPRRRGRGAPHRPRHQGGLRHGGRVASSPSGSAA
jgi:CheY-like chemotaxis protein